MPEERDIHLEHLGAELARIDVMVRHQARLMSLAGQDSSDTLRGLHIGDAQALAVAARPFASSWASQAKPSPKVAAAYARELVRAEAGIRKVVQKATAARTPTRLMHLTNAFGLSRFELDAFLIALAPPMDLRYEQLYGFLNDDVTSRSLCSFDEATETWVAELGTYTVKMGASSRNIKLKADFKLAKTLMVEKVNKALPMK